MVSNKLLSLAILLSMIGSPAFSDELDTELWPIAAQEKDGFDGKPIEAFSPPDAPQLIKVSKAKRPAPKLAKALDTLSKKQKMAKTKTSTKKRAKLKNQLPKTIDAKKDKSTPTKRKVSQRQDI